MNDIVCDVTLVGPSREAVFQVVYAKDPVPKDLDCVLNGPFVRDAAGLPI